MKIWAKLFILLWATQVANAQISLNCTSLNLGSFLLERGLTSAEDNGYSRIGLTQLVGQESSCQITGASNSEVLVELNSDNQNLSLINGVNSFNIQVRLEDLFETNLGTSTTVTIPSSSTTYDFSVDASVPTGQGQVPSGSYSNTIIIDISYN